MVRPNQTMMTNTFSSDHIDAGMNITEIIHSDILENYRQNFLPYLSTASKVPNIIFQLANLLFCSRYVRLIDWIYNLFVCLVQDRIEFE